MTLLQVEFVCHVNPIKVSHTDLYRIETTMPRPTAPLEEH